MAVADNVNPVNCYNSSGTVIDQIPASIGIGTSIRGLTFEPGTDSPIIWASNVDTDEIYQVDVDPPTPLDRSTWGEIKSIF
jgi:hypothetical protein